MVSSLLIDALQNPTRTIIELYDPTSPIDDFPALVKSHFTDIFKTVDAFQEIPSLDVLNPPEIFPSRSLVRFRAMIQDTSSSPEIYLSKRWDNRCGGWGIVDVDDEKTGVTKEPHEINYQDLRESTVLWAVTIPGESPWCANDIDGPLATSSMHVHHPPQPHKFPIPGAPHVGVQAKIYDRQISESLKSTDLVTFVGILTTEPIHSALDLENTTEVPTLHVLFSVPVPPTVVSRPYPYQPSCSVDATVGAVPTVLEVREELIGWIADEALGGDRETAEWVLLCAIARVQSRTPPILPPSLTISRFPSLPQTSTASVSTAEGPSNGISSQPNSSSPPLSPPTLAHVLTSILPISTTLPLSLPTLNTTQFFPSCQNEDLHSGWLQVPGGTTMLVTEGGVSEGVVLEQGLRNLASMQQMMTSQSIDYVFPFSQFNFPTDVSFIILCEGKKSAFFQTSLVIPLQPVVTDADLYKSAKDLNLPSNSEEKLDMFRGFVCGALEKAARGGVGVGEDTAAYIQDDFVKERKESDVGVTSEDLILRMLIARLMALSMHEEQVTIEIWKKTKALEERRKARLRL